MKYAAFLFCLLLFAHAAGAQGNAGLASSPTIWETRLSGSMAEKYTLVIMGDGFASADSDTYRQSVRQLIDSLFSIEPFKGRSKAFNVLTLNVTKPLAGIATAGSLMRMKPLLSTYQPQTNTVTINTDACLGAMRGLAANLGDYSIVVLLNTKGYGGYTLRSTGLDALHQRRFISGVTCHAQCGAILAHELGHVFGLGDEYDCSVCTDSTEYHTYPAGRPVNFPNLSADSTFEACKWKDEIDYQRFITQTLHDTAVGIVAGGGHCKAGIYRPTRHCTMQYIQYPFCTICKKEISKRLAKYQQRPLFVRNSLKDSMTIQYFPILLDGVANNSILTITGLDTNVYAVSLQLVPNAAAGTDTWAAPLQQTRYSRSFPVRPGERFAVKIELQQAASSGFAAHPVTIRASY